MKKVILILAIFVLLMMMPLGVAAEDQAVYNATELPEHSLYIGNTAVSINYLIGHPVDATQMVNQLVTEQSLSMADLWYRINDGLVLNIMTGMPATEEEMAAIQKRLTILIDKDGEAHNILPEHYAVGLIQVGSMNFNDVYVYEVIEVPDATHFAIKDIAALREIDSADPITFMGTGSKVLQITNDGGVVLATGTLVLPQEFGPQDFIVGLSLIEGTGILRGTALFDDQNGHEGITVTAKSEGVNQTTTTDVDGSFSFYNLPTGDLIVEASSENYYPTSQTTYVESGEETILEDALYLYPIDVYGSLEGYAKYIDKESHQGIAIHVQTVEGEELPDLIGLTDRNGYYSFPTIPVDSGTGNSTYIFTASAVDQTLGYGTDSITATVYADEKTTLLDTLWLRPAAIEVIIFADDPTPWDTESLYEMLNMTEAEYSIHGSDEMATLPLPIDKTVWIINDQHQSFYDAYAVSQARFDTFVSSGGTLLFEACDEGWNGGSIVGAGATLPGGVVNALKYDNYNYNVNPTHPMMTGVPYPDEMSGNRASHNYFTGLPEISTILCTDSSQNPTLVEYKYGQGRVVATGQPLEAAWSWSMDTKPIYPNMILYTFNKEIPEVPELAASGVVYDGDLTLSSGGEVLSSVA